MDERRLHRAARQALQIDLMLGADWTPLSEANPLAAALPAAAPAQPAAAPQPTAARPAPAAAAQAPAMPASPADQPLPADTMSFQEKTDALAELAARHAAECPHCSPKQGQLNMVFGEGDPDAAIMFVGEGPGAEEDRQGRPFVGRAGQLLDKQITAMSLERGDVYIANIVKTRPPGNRVPTPQEADLCLPFLQEQIEIIHPKVIVSLGATSAKYLLAEPKLAITRERGKWRTFRGIALMPTFHPAYLLRAYTRENRLRVWEDLKAVLEKADLPLPTAQS